MVTNPGPPESGLPVDENAPLILVVEDEEEVATAMQYKLALEGYQTRVALDGQSAIREVFREPLPDMVLLDIMLPDMSGIEICLKMREKPASRNIPVIMLTARGDEIDRIVGLEAGADDYLVKPFSIRELMLRIQIGLRRTQNPGQASAEILHVGDILLDKARHQVLLDNTPVPLSATEFKLLHLLMSRADRVLGRDTLLDTVWGVSAYVHTRTVDSHIKELRKKLGEARECIETVRGVGYRFNPRKARLQTEH